MISSDLSQTAIKDADLNTQLEQFEHKRALLSSLIRVAQDVVGHTHSLQDVLLLARPSQNFPSKVHHYKEHVEKAILFMDELQLKNRSKKYDSQSSHLLDALLEFIEITQLQVEEERTPSEFSDDIRFQLDEFKTVTQSAIVIRLLLQDLGLILPPVKFSFPQEWIGEQIASLNETNHHIRMKAVDKVAELIYDAEHILERSDLPDATKDALEYVQHAMKENLEHLEHGGNIEILPYEFEELELTAIPQAALGDYLAEKEAKEAALHPEHEEHEQKMSFNKKLKLWLNTPWETRWRDLD